MFLWNGRLSLVDECLGFLSPGTNPVALGHPTPAGSFFGAHRGFAFALSLATMLS